MTVAIKKAALKMVKEYLRENKVKAIHLVDCRCVTCTYDYPHKENMIDLIHCDIPMSMSKGFPQPLDKMRYADQITIIINKLRDNKVIAAYDLLLAMLSDASKPEEMRAVDKGHDI